MKATVYAVTTMHAAAEAFEKELPFQIAIVDIEGLGRTTVRIEGRPVRVGEEVVPAGLNTFRAARSA